MADGKKAIYELVPPSSYIPAKRIVDQISKNWPTENVNPETVHHQLRKISVNGHPGHDSYPDHGMTWKKHPKFVSNTAGGYRFYNKDSDQEIYNIALAEDEGLNQPPTSLNSGKTEWGRS